jgi:hypothetical protein
MTRLKKNVIGLLFIPCVLFCLSYTLENIQSYNLGKPAVCIDTLNNLYLVGNTTGNDTVKYITKVSGPWQAYTLAFSAVTGMNYNCRPSAAVGPDGSLHILYRVVGGTYGWPVYTNNAGGSFTSCDTLTKIGSESTYNYGICMDNLNRAHVVCEIYTGSSSVKYYYPYADSQFLIAANAAKPTVAVGKNNVVHIAYAAPTSGSKIYYTNNAGGTFSAPQLVSDSFGTDPSIAVDTSGIAHICFANGAWNAASDLFYATNKTGAFQAKKVSATPGLGEDYTQIALSRQNDVAIIAWLYRSSPQMSYITCATKKADDADFAVDSVGPAHTNASFGAITWNDRGLVIDPAGYLHFAYYSPAGAIYAKSMTPLGVREVVKQSPDANGFRFMGSRNPEHTPMTIAFQMAPSLSATLTLHDITGRLVRSFGEIRGERLVWDGRDQAGNQVNAGVYIVRATVRSGSGEIFTSTMKIVIVE